MDNELKPCPFCSGSVSVEQDQILLCGHKYWFIKHKDCNFVKHESGLFTTKEKAIEAWNKRV